MTADWRDNLPATRGRIERDADLAKLAWFRTGGPADILFRPEDEEDLATFLAGLDASVPVTVLGVGSNLLIRDGGIRGVVIRLAKNFAAIEADGETVSAGGIAPDRNVALAAQRAGIGGLEFLTGIPGTIGGAVRMNAGAYGREMKDVLVSATAIDRQGARHVVTLGELGMTYRHCSAPEGWIFTSAVMRGVADGHEAIRARMDEIDRARNDTQPVKMRTGGSTFKNPEGERAWALIDAAGCRGLCIGDAMVSEKHCNFLLNTGKATAADIETLGEEVRRRVRETSGIELEWEIRRLGEPAREQTR
jgi:UDP-N-acetylmuramate dehydrogenase